MNIYRNLVARGGPILMAISLIIFVVSLIGNFAAGSQLGGGDMPQPGMANLRFFLLLGMTGNALSNAALTFFGACLLDRADRYLTHRGGAR